MIAIRAERHSLRMALPVAAALDLRDDSGKWSVHVDRRRRDDPADTVNDASGKQRYLELRELADLYEAGAISDLEFRRRKRQILRGPVPATDQLELILVSYGDDTAAEAALDRLRGLQRAGVIVIIDATLIACDAAGALRLSEDVRERARGRSLAEGLRELVTTALPPGRVDSQVLGATLSRWAEIGFSAAELTDLGRQLEPGQTALVAVVFNLQADGIAQAIDGFAAFSRHHLGRHTAQADVSGESAGSR